MERHNKHVLQTHPHIIQNTQKKEVGTKKTQQKCKTTAY